MKKYTKIIEEKSFPTCIIDIDGIQLLEYPNGLHSLYDSNNDIELVPPKKTEIVPDDRAKLYFIKYEDLTIGDKNYMSIYDVQSHAFIFRSYLIDREFIPNEVILFKSLIDDTKRLFDKTTFRSEKSIHNRPIDEATMLETKDDKKPILISYDGATGLYYVGKGLNIEMAYSSIELTGNRAICSTKNYKRLITDSSVSSDYEDIDFDRTNRDIVYFHKDGVIHIYMIDGQLIPITKIRGDKTEFLEKSSWPTDCRGTYKFKVYADGKSTIIKTYVSGFLNRMNPNSSIVPDGRMFDDIEIKENVYFPIKNGLKGIIYGKQYVEPQYEKVEKLDDALFACYKSDRCDLVLLTPNPITISDCIIRERRPNGIIYETRDELGLYELGLLTYDSISSAKVTGEAIRWLLKDYYEIETERGIGVYQKGKFIIEPTTLGVELYSNEKEPSIIHAKIIAPPENTECADLKNSDDRVVTPFRDNRYLKFKHHNQKPATLSYEDKTAYEHIDFFEDFMVTYDCGITTIKSYNGQDIYVTGSPKRIEIAGTYGYAGKKRAIYAIEDRYFVFQANLLKEITPTNSRIFAAAYVSTYGIVAVNASDKDDFDQKCESIENITDKTFKSILEKNFRKSPELQSKYPHLVMKPIPKKD